jgi:hypothetical protein
MILQSLSKPTLRILSTQTQDNTNTRQHKHKTTQTQDNTNTGATVMTRNILDEHPIILAESRESIKREKGDYASSCNMIKWNPELACRRILAHRGLPVPIRLSTTMLSHKQSSEDNHLPPKKVPDTHRLNILLAYHFAGSEMDIESLLNTIQEYYWKSNQNGVVIKHNLHKLLSPNPNTWEHLRQRRYLFLSSYVSKRREFNLSLIENVNFEETEKLEGIDGYVVCNGVTVHLTMKANLSPDEKSRGVEILMKRCKYGQEIGVYMWKVDDDLDESE